MDKHQVLNLVDEILNQSVSNYSQAKEQSRKIDQLLGYQCESIEKDLINKNHSQYFLNCQEDRQLWFGLDVQSLQTPYSEIREMLNYLKPHGQEMWLDLGAAYGRMGIVLSLFSAEIQFLGYEVVKERVAEGNRIYDLLNLPKARLIHEDLASESFVLPEADLYFLYDFGSKKDVYSLLEKLKKHSQKRSLRVIARGRGIKNWIYQENPWLYISKDPTHFENWSLFET